MMEEREDVTAIAMDGYSLRPGARVVWVSPFRWSARPGHWMYEVIYEPGTGDVIRPDVPAWSKKWTEQFHKHMAKMAAKTKAKAKRAAKKAAAVPAPRKRKTA